MKTNNFKITGNFIKITLDKDVHPSSSDRSITRRLVKFLLESNNKPLLFQAWDKKADIVGRCKNGDVLDCEFEIKFDEESIPPTRLVLKKIEKHKPIIPPANPFKGIW